MAPLPPSPPPANSREQAPRRPTGHHGATNRAPHGAADPIRGPDNASLVLVRSLLAKRAARAAEHAFVVEGRRAVADAIAAGARPRLILLRDGADDALPPNLPPAAPLRRVDARVFDRLSGVVSPQGILAVFPFPDPDVPPSTPHPPLALVVDRLRDPGNLGTLLRTAAGAGVTAVYLSPETVDPFNPKVVRAGMGAHFRVPLRPLDEAMAHLAADYPLRVVARADAPLPYDAVDWRGPAALIVGAEAAGISPAVAPLGTIEVAIPLAAGVESLNAAAAAAIILFEAARQRRAGSPWSP